MKGHNVQRVATSNVGLGRKASPRDLSSEELNALPPWGGNVVWKVSLELLRGLLHDIVHGSHGDPVPQLAVGDGVRLISKLERIRQPLEPRGLTWRDPTTAPADHRCLRDCHECRQVGPPFRPNTARTKLKNAVP